jgi:hypothetical protein
MPLYIDIHHLPGATSRQVAEAHFRDLQMQGRYDVRYLRYWVAESKGAFFCLVDAPDPETASSVHREAHGLVANEIFEVLEGT